MLKFSFQNQTTSCPSQLSVLTHELSPQSDSQNFSRTPSPSSFISPQGVTLSQISFNDSESLEETKVEGNRIVDINYLFQQFNELSYHSPEGSTFKDMQLLKEKRTGAKYTWTFSCDMCRKEAEVYSVKTDPTKMDITSNVVMGGMNIGGGFTTVTEFLSQINVPPLSKRSYYERHKKFVNNGWSLLKRK